MSGLLQWRKNTQEANYENSIPTSQAPSGPTSSSAKNIPQAPLKTVSPKTVSPKNSVTWGPNEEIFFYKQSPPNAVSAKSKLNTSILQQYISKMAGRWTFGIIFVLNKKK